MEQGKGHLVFFQNLRNIFEFLSFLKYKTYVCKVDFEQFLFTKRIWSRRFQFPDRCYHNLTVTYIHKYVPSYSFIHLRNTLVLACYWRAIHVHQWKVSLWLMPWLFIWGQTRRKITCNVLNNKDDYEIIENNEERMR